MIIIIYTDTGMMLINVQPPQLANKTVRSAAWYGFLCLDEVHFAPEKVTGKIVWIVSFEHADGYLDTGEMETNLRLTYSDLKQFTGFILTDANTHFSNTIQWLPLTARHRLNKVLMYDMEKRR